MIDFGRQIIKLMGKEERIKGFGVFFQTPFGLFNDLDAIKKVIANDMTPDLTIRPVAVAISETLLEVCP